MQYILNDFTLHLYTLLILFTCVETECFKILISVDILSSNCWVCYLAYTQWTTKNVAVYLWL